MWISPHLSVILDLFPIPSSLYLIMSIVYLALASTTYANFIPYFIRQSLRVHAITILVYALICTRVDYGNAVYIGLSSTNSSKLQSVLNAAAHLKGGIPKFSHISSFIRTSLHWLPIRQQIQFKIFSLIRNCLTGSAPQYLNAYCIPVSSIPI